MKEAQLFCYFLYFSFESELGERVLSGNDLGLGFHGSAVAAVCAAVSESHHVDTYCVHVTIQAFSIGMT